MYVEGELSRGAGFSVSRTAYRYIVLVVLTCCVLSVAFAAQQQPAPEDPEDDKQLGLWLDQGISIPFSTDKSVEVEFHERFDEGASNLYEYFAQVGIAFRPRPWLIVIPTYRYQRYPGNPTVEYESRLQLNLTRLGPSSISKAADDVTSQHLHPPKIE